MITTVVFCGSWKFGGKSTWGDTFDGGTIVVVVLLDVGSIGGGVPGNGVVGVVVVVVVLPDGMVEVNIGEVVPFG